MADAIAAAALMAPPASGGLSKPTDRPDLPVTDGLPIGPGAGVGKIGMPLVPEEDAALRQLTLAYQVTGSSAIARLIDVLRIRADARNQTIQSGRQPRSIGPARPL
jgi:hypothetical protein